MAAVLIRAAVITCFQLFFTMRNSDMWLLRKGSCCTIQALPFGVVLGSVCPLAVIKSVDVDRYFPFIISKRVSVLISLSNRAGMGGLHLVFKSRMFLLGGHKYLATILRDSTANYYNSLFTGLFL